MLMLLFLLLLDCLSSDESSMVGSLTLQLVGFSGDSDPRIQALRYVLQQIVPRCVEVRCTS